MSRNQNMLFKARWTRQWRMERLEGGVWKSPDWAGGSMDTGGNSVVESWLFVRMLWRVRSMGLIWRVWMWLRLREGGFGFSDDDTVGRRWCLVETVFGDAADCCTDVDGVFLGGWPEFLGVGWAVWRGAPNGQSWCEKFVGWILLNRRWVVGTALLLR